MSALVGEQVRDAQALIVRRAIILWVQSGIKANRAYTPKNMAATAGSITGKRYTSSKKSLQQAADDIAAKYPGICR
jgi:hypothetical protein